MGTLTFPLMAFARHRIGIDGQGVTTLVAAWGCPLHCRYCLNPQCQAPDTPRRDVTPEELYGMARVDDLYFQATLGGVTFGGGEPLLHASFISAFRALTGGRWRISAETSLCIPDEALRIAINCVDEFIVDVKEMNPDIYQRYTGRENDTLLRNLGTLLSAVGPERVLARLPHIPGYNEPDDVSRGREALARMGINRIDEFTYSTRRKGLSREDGS
mgnify:CR=1 FL=1